MSGRRFSARLPAGLVAGLALTAALAALALLSLAWTPEAPERMQIARRLAAPLQHGLLGTDAYGRDVASILMVGARNSLATVLPAVLLGAGFGTLFGMALALRQGIVETVTMRICDVVFAVPPILSAMVLAAFIGPGQATAVIAIAVFMVPVFTRLSHAAAKQVLAREFVLAAVALGRSQSEIARIHVWPNIAGQIVVQFSVQLGLAILTEAGLSFLGLGMPVPAPSWGRMLADSQTYFQQAPWLALAPGIAIALAVTGFNLVGDGLRDLLDPRR